ncbi:hypothetical protein BDZ91DRAFT_717874 [Kalaharituber pfeilii]|nr:hypothetical protein BDZ91DRAFT_717874 [Kalaharituber pfeilii]
MGQSGGGGDLRLDAGLDDGICCGGDSGRGCQRIRSGVLLSPVMENKDSIEGPCLSPSWGSGLLAAF